MSPETVILALLYRFASRPESIATMSTGEACAVALLFNRLDLLAPPYNHPLAAFDRLDADWQAAVMLLHKDGFISDMGEGA